jgi:hypothetical protein
MGIESSQFRHSPMKGYGGKKGTKKGGKKGGKK